MTIVTAGERSAKRDLLIKGAGILTLDREIGDLQTGDILVRDGKIADIGVKLKVVDAEVLDATAMIAMPGFVDAHRHLWEGVIRNTLPTEDLNGYFARVNNGFAPAYSADDAYLGTLVSALGALDAGITTVFDWAHIQTSRAHTDATLAALRESGLRTVFGFGPGARDDQGAAWPHDLLRIQKEEFHSRDDLVTLALAGYSPEHCDDGFAKLQFGLAKDAGVIISVHSGLHGMGTPNEIERFGREGLLGPHVQLVHCNTLTATEWKWIADTGTTACITPGTEMQQGQGVPPIQAALDVGYKPALGADVETSVPNDMWTQMRLVFALQRMQAFEKQYAGKDAPAKMDMDDILECAVTAGAHSAGLGDKIGSLTPGKEADIILLRADMLNVMPVNDMRTAIVLNMDARNVDAVIVRGRVVKRDGKMIGIDMKQLGERLYASRDRVYGGTSDTIPSPVVRLGAG
jgi:5-methylthioadenosine/S-adenosylhomocysteine deaminase